MGALVEDLKRSMKLSIGCLGASFSAAMLWACTAEQPAFQVLESDPPQIQILSPDRGAISAEPTVTVSGIVRDEGSGIDSVWINGRRAHITDRGEFALTLPNENMGLIEVLAQDGAGNTGYDVRAVLQDQFEAHTQALDLAGVMRLVDNSLDLLRGPVEDLVRQIDFNALLADLQVDGPLVDQCFTSSCTSGVEIWLDALCYEDVHSDLRLRDGGLALNLNLQGPIATGRARIYWNGIAYNVPIEARIDEVRARANIVVEKTGDSFDFEEDDVFEPDEPIDDTTVYVEGPVQIEFENIGYELACIEDGWLTNLAASFDLLTGFLESMVEDVVRKDAIGALEEVLLDLRMQTADRILDSAFALDAGLQKMRFRKEELYVGFFSQVTPLVPGHRDSLGAPESEPVFRPVDDALYYKAAPKDSGFVAIGKSVDDLFASTPPPNLIETASGFTSDTKDRPAEELGPYDPFAGSSAGFQSAVDLNVVNQFLSSLWSNAALNTEFELEPTAAISTGIRKISTRFGLPMVVTQADDGMSLRLKGGELYITVRTTVGDKLLDGVAILSGELGLTTNAFGKLALDVSNIKVSLQPLWSNRDVFNPDQLSFAINLMQDTLAERVGEMLKELEILQLRGTQVTNIEHRFYDKYWVVEGDATWNPTDGQRNFFTDEFDENLDAEGKSLASGSRPPVNQCLSDGGVALTCTQD